VLLLLVGLGAVAGLASGCASGPKAVGDPGDFEDEIAALEQRLADDAADTEALRDLGALYVRSRQPARGYDTLRRVFARQTEQPGGPDPKTLFYLGLASEQVGKTEAALDVMARYDRVPADSKYRRLMRGRYERLVRQALRTDLRQQIDLERQRSRMQVSDRILAVLPLEFVGGDERFAPLGRGLSELMIVDFAHVRRLRVVERIRLQVLLDEIELGQTAAVDNRTAPRMGRILGAGRLVGGSFAVEGEERILLNVAVAEISGQTQYPSTGEEAGALDRLFEIEKRVVFRVLDDLGIELTPAEREAIERVPTRNLQAFLAYSRGLAAEDRGFYPLAAAAYAEAAALDPGFTQAAERQQAAEGLSVAGGSIAQTLAQSLGIALATPINLMQVRQQRMANALFDADGERDAGEEGAAAALPLSGELPPPPRPASSSGGDG
jgi:TolB-like protein